MGRLILIFSLAVLWSQPRMSGTFFQVLPVAVKESSGKYYNINKQKVTFTTFRKIWCLRYFGTGFVLESEDIQHLDDSHVSFFSVFSRVSTSSDVKKWILLRREWQVLFHFFAHPLYWRESWTAGVAANLTWVTQDPFSWSVIWKQSGVMVV